MLQDNSLILEPQFLCDLCSEAVTHPICPTCITAEIENWIDSYPKTKLKLLPTIKKVLVQIEDKLVESTQCIKCNKKRAAICPGCFTEYVLNELKRLGSNKKVLIEYLNFFNFDFEHNKYYKEAEKLGVV